MSLRTTCTRFLLPAFSLTALVAGMFFAPRANAQGDEAARPRRLTASAGYSMNRNIAGATDFQAYSFSLYGEYGGWLAGVTTSYIEIDGPQTLIGDITGGGRGDVSVPSSKERGAGDTTLNLAYAWAQKGWRPFLELEAKLKIPTASEKRQLGTGTVDTTLEVEVARSFGRLTPFAVTGITIYGGSTTLPAVKGRDEDGPVRVAEEKIDLDEAFYASLGASVEVTRFLSLGFYYDWSQSPVDGVPAAHQILPYASIKLGKYLRISPSGVIGLSSQAPEWGFGTQLSVSY